LRSGGLERKKRRNGCRGMSGEEVRVVGELDIPF
jgi:hypothetical protein